MTKRETRGILRWFQRNIGLLGWKVSITVGGPPKDLGSDIPVSDRNNWCGCSKSYTQFHRASIWVNPGGMVKPK